jgi:hypothetical protein
MRSLVATLLAAATCRVFADPMVELCDQQLPPARVEVRADFAEPTISFALSANQIKPLSDVKLPGVSLGLTRVDRRVEQQVALFSLREVGSERVCARPQIEMILALHRVDILVARELAGDDCLVAEVWHHELRHFAIWQETMTEVAAELERLMQAHYDGLVLLGTEAEVRAEVDRDLRGRWANEIETLSARGEIEHELLDARDAQNDSGWCDGALRRMNGRFR